MTNEECWIRCIVIVKNSAEKDRSFSYTRPEDLMQSIYRGIIPDLLILDIEMPEVSGLEFQSSYREIRWI